MDRVMILGIENLKNLEVQLAQEIEGLLLKKRFNRHKVKIKYMNKFFF